MKNTKLTGLSKSLLGIALTSLLLIGCPTSKDITYSDIEVNEKNAITKITNIVSNQVTMYEKEQRFATSKELEISSRQVKGYKIEMTSNNETFQIWATPTKYGISGKTSFYSDNNAVDILGNDVKGKKTSKDSPIVESLPSIFKETLKK